MPELLISDNGSVRILTLNRPEVRNALSTALRLQLVDELRRADDSSTVAVLVLTGADPAFSAGVDVRERVAQLEKVRPDAEPVDPATVIRTLRKPVICAANGPCVTGALEIALSCAFIVASDRASFADTHVKVGLHPRWGMTGLLPQAVGIRMARQLSLTSAFVGAADALRIGLVNEVVPHAELLSRATELATTIAQADQRTVQALLSLYDGTSCAQIRPAIEAEQDSAEQWTVDPATTWAGFQSVRSRTAEGK